LLWEISADKAIAEITTFSNNYNQLGFTTRKIKIDGRGNKSAVR